MGKKLYDVDNYEYLNLLTALSNAFNRSMIKIITYKNKAIIIPCGARITNTKTHIPHITNLGTEYKYCSKCREWKPVECFIKNKFTPDKLKDVCKYCDNKRRRERYAKIKAVT